MFPTASTLGSQATLNHPAAALQAAQASNLPPHLLIPCATSTEDACQTLLANLQLPHLQRLLNLANEQQRQKDAPAGTEPELTLTPPHEWALARVLHLLPANGQADAEPRTEAPAALDGLLPWAAWAARVSEAAEPHHAPTTSPNTPAAWLIPCHQEIGNGHVTLHAPAHLDLSDAHSQALMAALQPLAAEDGLTLTWVAADRWLAQGPSLAALPTASLDRVAGRSIAPWMGTSAGAAGLRRLQSEAQMLFYTHPAHDQREAQRLAPINAIWVSGSGVCPPSARLQAPECAVVTTLRDAALVGNWPAWAQVWQTLDAQVLPAWLAHAQRGHPMQLTLCGERASLGLTFTPRSLLQGWQHKISSLFAMQRFHSLVSQL